MKQQQEIIKCLQGKKNQQWLNFSFIFTVKFRFAPNISTIIMYFMVLNLCHFNINLCSSILPNILS